MKQFVVAVRAVAFRKRWLVGSREVGVTVWGWRRRSGVEVARRARHRWR